MLPFTWLGLLALAWVVIELTHQPAFGAVFVCLKFGWEDFATARWLWRRDPDRWRRRGTFWLYLAWGWWKTAGVAFLMSVGFSLVARRNPGAPGALLAFLNTFLTTLIGFGLCVLMTALAVFCAWVGDARLWLDSGVYRARRDDVWPPSAYCAGRANRLATLLLTALGLGFFLLIVAVLAVGERLGHRAAFLLSFGLSITAPVLIVLGREVVSRKVWAATPLECWGDESAADDWRDAEGLRYSESVARAPAPGCEDSTRGYH